MKRIKNNRSALVSEYMKRLEDINQSENTLLIAGELKTFIDDNVVSDEFENAIDIINNLDTKELSNDIANKFDIELLDEREGFNKLVEDVISRLKEDEIILDDIIYDEYSKLNKIKREIIGLDTEQYNDNINSLAYMNEVVRIVDNEIEQPEALKLELQENERILSFFELEAGENVFEPNGELGEYENLSILVYSSMDALEKSCNGFNQEEFVDSFNDKFSQVLATIENEYEDNKFITIKNLYSLREELNEFIENHPELDNENLKDISDIFNNEIKEILPEIYEDYENNILEKQVATEAGFEIEEPEIDEGFSIDD